MLKQCQIAVKVSKCFLSTSILTSWWTNSVHTGTSLWVALWAAPLTCYFLPDIPHFCWSPLFWTDRHTGLSSRVKSLHSSLKCFLIFVFWNLSPTLCLGHAASSLCLEFSGLTRPKPQIKPWVILLQVIQGPYFENTWRVLQGTIWLDF